MRKIRYGDFLFYKKTLCNVKAGNQHLSFNIFWYTRRGHTIKANFETFQTVDPEICSISIICKKARE